MTELLNPIDLQPEDTQHYDLNSPTTIGEFFIDPRLGKMLYKFVAECGSITVRSSGYKQINAGDENDFLVATAYTHTGYDAEGSEKLLHAVITPKNKAKPITAVSISFETGVPIVTRSDNQELSLDEYEAAIVKLIDLIAIGVSQDTGEFTDRREQSV